MKPTFPVSVTRRTAANAVRGESRWSPDAVIALDRAATKTVRHVAREAVRRAREDERMTVTADHVASAADYVLGEVVPGDSVDTDLYDEVLRHNAHLEDWVRETHEALREAGITPPPFPGSVK